MKFKVVCLSLALIGSGLAFGATQEAAAVAPEASPESSPHLTRVLYLQDIQGPEAMTLCRSQARIVRMAAVGARNAIVVSDVADKVDRCESLLREQDRVARAADPHGPIDFAKLEQSEPESRVLAVGTDNARTAAAVLRAIYQVKELEDAQGKLTIHAPAMILDSSAALLRELGLMGG